MGLRSMRYSSNCSACGTSRKRCWLRLKAVDDDDEGAAAHVAAEVVTPSVDDGRVPQSTLVPRIAGTKRSQATQLEGLMATIKRQQIANDIMLAEEEAAMCNKQRSQEVHPQLAGGMDPTTFDFSKPWTTLLDLERLIWIAGGRAPTSFQSEILKTRLSRWNQMARNYVYSPWSPGYYDYDNHARKLERLYVQELDIVASCVVGWQRGQESP